MKCKNCVEGEKACYYTGKENNPRGLGWCAAHDIEGKRRKGCDGHW